MSMLSNLLALSKTELKAKLQSIDTSAVKGRAIKRKFETIRRKEGGFTLLELLVVVAILAAIAGTATIMLQDTDRKGAAAAHVAMMDELSKGIQTFRVLNGGLYPDVWDSLLGDGGVTASVAVATAPAPVGTGVGLSALISQDLADNLALKALTSDDVSALNNAGIYRVRELTGATGCADADIKDTVLDKNNNIVPQNIYRTTAANGCGKDTHTKLADTNVVAVWGGEQQRVGVPIGAPATTLVAFGIGPDSTLFEPTRIGALSNVPVYRHVTSDEYNRFIVLFNLNPVIEEFDGATQTFKTAGGQASFQAIIDGAGDTKDEELGEVDNTRPT